MGRIFPEQCAKPSDVGGGQPTGGTRLDTATERELSQLAAGATAKGTFKNIRAWFAFVSAAVWDKPRSASDRVWPRGQCANAADDPASGNIFVETINFIGHYYLTGHGKEISIESTKPDSGAFASRSGGVAPSVPPDTGSAGNRRRTGRRQIQGISA